VRVGRPILACTKQGSPVDRILTRSGLSYAGLYKEASEEEVDRTLLEFLRLLPEVRMPSGWFQENFDARNQALYLSRLIG
jgi:hypothetical protein